jgi:SAM-dependent methyltransferase
MAGAVIPLDLGRWRAEADDVERGILAAVPDPVLDIGCGPGRIAGALAEAGRVVLGIDPAPHAVVEAHRRGTPVLQRSVFEPLPAEGRWATTVLFDGNVGIGGDPRELLARVGELLRPGGAAVVEVEAPGTPTEEMVVRLQRPGRPPSPPFAWARVGADGIGALMAGAGFVRCRVEAYGSRWFAWATKL